MNTIPLTPRMMAAIKATKRMWRYDRIDFVKAHQGKFHKGFKRPKLRSYTSIISFQ